MEIEKSGGTPLKFYSTMQISAKLVTHSNDSDKENRDVVGTPGKGNSVSGRDQRKLLHPRTPSKPRNCNMSTNMSGSSTSSTSSKQMSVFSTTINTPPAKRFHRIRNPFEPVLAERLHLPLIASPSLFQRPATPQLSSTQFEWNIEEVSLLQPANVEPHETQFHDSPDPEYEAKAQSAISSYFKEQQIVPSPVDCPLRNQRILLSELNSNTPITKAGRRIRDCSTQTELSLPVVLPRALEEALMPYFQPHLCVEERRLSFDMNNGEIVLDANSIGMTVPELKDMSLRRKLFDMKNIVVLEEGEDGEGARTPTTKTPGTVTSNASSTSSCDGDGGTRTDGGMRFAIVGKLSPLDKSSFGSLSPILATDRLSNSPQSPQDNHGETKLRIHTFVENLSDTENLSPIHPPVRQTSSRRCVVKSQRSGFSITGDACSVSGLQRTPNRYNNNNSNNKLLPKDSYRCAALNQSEATTLGDNSLSSGDKTNVEDFTPDRSSSPLHANHSAADAAIGQHSIDSSFNLKVSRLVVNSAKCVRQQQKQQQQRPPPDRDVFAHDDTVELMDDDDIQVSQLSGHNFNCSSSSSTDTPRSKRRSASRKNLSQSFSLNWLEDDDDDGDAGDGDEEGGMVAQAAVAAAEKLQKSPIDVPRINIAIVDELIGKDHQLKQQQQQRQQQQKLQLQAQTSVGALLTNDHVQLAHTNSSNESQDNANASNNEEATRALFYRTDSGFNDMPASGSTSTYSIGGASQPSEQCTTLPLSPSKQMDVSLVCCSTPSNDGNPLTGNAASAAATS